MEVQAGAFLNKIIGSYGAAFNYQVEANRGPDTYAVTAGTLPTDLVLMVPLVLLVVRPPLPVTLLLPFG